MKYKVLLTAPAQNDLLKNAAYISCHLLNPVAADHYLTEVTDKLCILGSMPQMYATVNDGMLSRLGVRMLRINSYLAFYRINEDEHTVTVLRIVHEKQDWKHILI